MEGTILGEAASPCAATFPGIIRLSCRTTDGKLMRALRRIGRNGRNPYVNRPKAKRSLVHTAAATTVALLASVALLNQYLARKAERDNPPAGRFIEAKGVRLHYVERGRGDAVVMLHGNGSMIQDFESSGLADLVAENHRAVVIDRPGFGHSDRPRNVVWTPDAQAEVIGLALAQLGVSRAIILGHSWGASVAVALALRSPDLVRGLVLASGYYYPTFRPQLAALSVPSLPLIGDVLSQTLSPLVSSSDVAAVDVEDVWTPICAGEIQGVSEGDGAPSFAGKGIGR